MVLSPKLRISVAILLALGFHFALPVSGLAQAWLPEKGTGYFSTTVQNIDTAEHLFSADLIDSGINFGDEVDLGDIRSNTMIFSADYGLTKKLALSGSLGLVRSKYDGPFPEAARDDGAFHASLQDFSVDLRYMLLRSRSLVITPFAGATVPTHDYEIIGHTAIGRNLNEFRMGTNIGWQLNPISPDLFLQARYSYSIVENVGTLDLNRSNVDLVIGYFLTKSIQINGFGSFMKVHGGIDWLTDINTSEDFHTHDQAAATEFTQAGIGASFSLTPGYTINIGYATTISGENSHQADFYTIGTSWNFGRGRSRALANARSARLASSDHLRR